MKAEFRNLNNIENQASKGSENLLCIISFLRKLIDPTAGNR